MPAIPQDMEQFRKTFVLKPILYGPPDCPHPEDKQDMGFGLAGGGYGPYLFCKQCYRVLEKWEELT